MGILGIEISAAALILGVITGLSYAALAVALVLIFRSSGIINLALGEIGAVGAVFVGVATVRWGWWYWPAFAVAVTISGAVGALVNVSVVRRLRRAPRVMTLVAMLGVGQVLFFLSDGFGSLVDADAARLHPPGVAPFEISGFLVMPSQAAGFVICPLTLAAIVLFLHRHPLGRAMTASAAAPQLARASGISPIAMSSVAWAAAGALAALVATLLLPAEQIAGQSLGLWLLLRPLAAAVIAGMRNLATAAGAGLAIGVVEQSVLWNSADSGSRDLLLFVIVVVVLAFRRIPAWDAGEKGRWLLVSPTIASERIRRLSRTRGLRSLAMLLATGAVVVLLATTSPTGAMRLYFVFAFATVGLAVAVITGLVGQLSLGQFAVAGIGAAVSVGVTITTGNFPLGLAAAGSAAALITVALGAMSERSGGQSFAVVTLAFAIFTESWLLARGWIFGDGVFPGQPVLGGLPLDTSRRYAPFAFVVFVIALLLVRNGWQTQIGRRMVAGRDNEVAARAFGIDPWRTRASGYALGGFAAGLGGASLAHGLFLVTPATFSVSANVDSVALTALGGFGSVWGPALGAFYVAGLPELLPSGWGFLATTSLGWLLLILLFPGGISQAAAAAADRIARLRLEDRVGSPRMQEVPRLMPADVRRRNLHAIDPILHVVGVSKAFAELKALDDVSLAVGRNESVAIIGSNGAGKTTLLDVVGGSVAPDAGRIIYDGIDITCMPPERRASRGLIRSFEDADLFATMTVLDVVHLAVATGLPQHPLHLLARGAGAEARSAGRASELVSVMGLGPFAHRRVGQLSTGLRRLAEFALVVASGPKLVLLDEPTSGIAQAEVDPLVDVIRGIARHLDLTLVVVEHDLAVVAELCPRVLLLDQGRLVAEGTGEQILRISGLSRNTNGGGRRSI